MDIIQSQSGSVVKWNMPVELPGKTSKSWKRIFVIGNFLANKGVHNVIPAFHISDHVLSPMGLAPVQRLGNGRSRVLSISQLSNTVHACPIGSKRHRSIATVPALP